MLVFISFGRRSWANPDSRMRGVVVPLATPLFSDWMYAYFPFNSNTFPESIWQLPTPLLPQAFETDEKHYVRDAEISRGVVKEIIFLMSDVCCWTCFISSLRRIFEWCSFWVLYFLSSLNVNVGLAYFHACVSSFEANWKQKLSQKSNNFQATLTSFVISVHNRIFEVTKGLNCTNLTLWCKVRILEIPDSHTKKKLSYDLELVLHEAGR